MDGDVIVPVSVLCSRQWRPARSLIRNFAMAF